MKIQYYRYADLKSRGKLKKYLDRKHKKQSVRDRNIVPNRRYDQQE